MAWGFVIFIGLIFVFWDLHPVTRARWLGRPMLIHTVVIGSGLLIHGGSAEGAMAAIASGIFAAIYMRIARRAYGYLKGDKWIPGAFTRFDPRFNLRGELP